MYLSDKDRREMLADGLDPKRRDDFLVADRLAPPIPFEVYLQWLTDMSKWFPQPPRRDFLDYKRNLL